MTASEDPEKRATTRSQTPWRDSRQLRQLYNNQRDMQNAPPPIDNPETNLKPIVDLCKTLQNNRPAA